nr:ferrochelatase [Saprospiraceae bacterium]
PHYAMSSYETAVVHVEQTHAKGRFPFKLSVVPPYYKDDQYLSALAESIKPYLERDYDCILFSYHGIPERHLRKTDPTGSHCLKCENCCESPSAAHAFCYRHQVLETTKGVADLLNIPADKYSVSFQSRLGPDKWLEPSTSGELKRFPGDGIKKLIVVCPAFVSDCLETLEEIWVEGKEDFEKAGGETFEVVPCLNLHPKWVKTIDHLIQRPE